MGDKIKKVKLVVPNVDESELTIFRGIAKGKGKGSADLFGDFLTGVIADYNKRFFVEDGK